MVEHILSGSLILLVVEYQKGFTLWIPPRALVDQMNLVSFYNGCGILCNKCLRRTSRCYGMIQDESQLLELLAATLF